MSGASSLGREAIEPTRKSLVRSLRAANQIFNKTKEFFGSLKYYLRMQTTNLRRRCGPKEILLRQNDSSVVFLRKTDDARACA